MLKTRFQEFIDQQSFPLLVATNHQLWSPQSPWSSDVFRFSAACAGEFSVWSDSHLAKLPLRKISEVGQASQMFEQNRAKWNRFKTFKRGMWRSIVWKRMYESATFDTQGFHKLSACTACCGVTCGLPGNSKMEKRLQVCTPQNSTHQCTCLLVLYFNSWAFLSHTC